MSTEAKAVYDEIRRRDREGPQRKLTPTESVDHSVTFYEADTDDELAEFSALGAMPIPRVGDQVELQDWELIVTRVSTYYSRHAEGRTWAFTKVHVHLLS
ncbi:hypothetical protein [Streptomyces sp. DT18]